MADQRIRTVEIASEAGAEVVTGPASRGGQLRRGGAAAGGDWVLFLHADSVLGGRLVGCRIGRAGSARERLCVPVAVSRPRVCAADLWRAGPICGRGCSAVDGRRGDGARVARATGAVGSLWWPQGQSGTSAQGGCGAGRGTCGF
ncbi:hypothetical protein GQR58_000526 [Nymphon striatum]|nr:hypothetical protein GQR58_000526 [Nymphon striatum]